MAVAKLINPGNLAHALELLGNKAKVKLGNNTYLVPASPAPVVEYHDNIIVEYALNSVKITLAGWDTLTTRGRLNQLLPPGYSVSRVQGVTYLVDANALNETVMQANETYQLFY